MSVAFLSDVHGNLPALETCLEQISASGCTAIYCLGDIFGYLADGQGCFELLHDVGARMLLGNHEAMLLGHLPVGSDSESLVQLEPSRRKLPSATRLALQRLVPFRETQHAGRRQLLVHGTPADPLQGYGYPDGDYEWMSRLPYDCVLMGNTHRAFICDVGSMQVVNVGSVGLPRDIGNASSFATLDEDTGRVSLHRVPIDVELVRARYREAHPSVLAVFDRRLTS